MKLVNCVIIVQVSYLCQAFQNSSTQQGQSGLQVKADGNTTKPSEESNSDPYVLQHPNRCTWTLKMPGNRSNALVPLTAETRDALADQICHDLDCGSFYNLKETRSPADTVCYDNCSYYDRRLQNCSELVGRECTVISEVVCGHQLVQLAGGVDRCAGRVEVWRSREWGTVCDDRWDLRDADVVCAQLRCGYALRVSGQGGSFPQGSGPIHLDELNCTGTEDNLFACPSAQQGHDCGHKEDAGVVCSEMKAVRLTGGVDRCSGKVEIHRNGRWGTVCDSCWSVEEASMVCSMLKCGDTAQQYTQFNPPIAHNNGTLWFYTCRNENENLWECTEYFNKTHLCVGSRAAGLICNGSRGFLIPTTHNASLMTSWTTAPPPGDSPAGGSGGGFLANLTSQLLACIALSLGLLVALIINSVLCCHYRRRSALLLQWRHTNPQASSDRQHDYGDAVNLIQVTTCKVERDVPSNPRCLRTQLSSADSTSLDTDYEQFDPSNDPSVCLSTFRNSQRYRKDVNAMMKASALNSLSEEAPVPGNEVKGVLTNHNDFPLEDDYAKVSKHCSFNPSVDSFESSSTSSGECYENTTNAKDLTAPGITAPYQPSVCHSTTDTSKPFSNNQFHYGQIQSSQDPGDGTSADEEEDPLYSPVSPDCNASSAEEEYDDIENYP